MPKVKREAPFESSRRDQLPTIYTIGHSNRALEDFLGLLREFDIRALADIRRFPGSRRHPWFSQDALGDALKSAGIEYHWFRDLGGFRGKPDPGSPNTGLRHPAFRSYADHMPSSPFQEAVTRLMQIASDKRTVYMCAELLYWHCHRMLLSDFFVARGWEVIHILGPGKTKPHQLTAAARVEDGIPTYPPEQPELF